MSKPDNNHTSGGGQLIPITNMGEGGQAVLGRDLHGFLEVKTPYKDWWPRMVAYGFEEGVDYALKNEHSASPAGMPSRSRLTRSEILLIALNAEEERLALEAANKQLQPKADAYDCFIDSTGSYSMGTVAKMLGIGQNTLFRELRNRGILITKGDMRNTPCCL